ncbi:hypothetical protein N2152v2_008083 [Parachlorella kessleri]
MSGPVGHPDDNFDEEAFEDAAPNFGTPNNGRHPVSGLAGNLSASLSPWNKAHRDREAYHASSYPKHSTPPPRSISDSLPRAPGPLSAGKPAAVQADLGRVTELATRRPQRYHSAQLASELGTPGRYPAGAGLSRSFEEGELGDDGSDRLLLGGGEVGQAQQLLYGATPRQEERRSPQRAASPWVPPGMDPTSYTAGERAAALQAFQKALPTHQALGQLLAALEALASRLDRESEQWHHLQAAQVRTASQVEAILQRLDTLEFMRVPQLQQACEEAAVSRGQASTSADLGEAVHGLQAVLSNLTQQQQLLLQQMHQQQLHQKSNGSCGSGSAAVLGNDGGWSQLRYLLWTAGGYAQQALSKVDVAAMFLSRRILLCDTQACSHNSSKGWQLAQKASAAALFLASVEALWHGQQALARRQQRKSPQQQQHLRTLELTLRVARGAVWSAAAVLAAAGLRGACSAAAEWSCEAARAAVPANGLLPRLAWLARLVGRGTKDCDEVVGRE